MSDIVYKEPIYFHIPAIFEDIVFNPATDIYRLFSLDGYCRENTKSNNND